MLNTFRRYCNFFLSNLNRHCAWARVSFSQFGEDIILQEIFKGQKNGFYVDVGAYHPFAYSNTYLLYRSGWRGINIEPNPSQFPLFQKFRQKDTNLNFAISQNGGFASFMLHGTFSGIDDTRSVFSTRFPSAPRVQVETRRLDAVFDEFLPANMSQIDLISIDCEGHELSILDSNDWSRYSPRILAIEDHAKGENTELDVKISQLGFSLHSKAYLTKIFERNT